MKEEFEEKTKRGDRRKSLEGEIEGKARRGSKEIGEMIRRERKEKFSAINEMKITSTYVMMFIFSLIFRNTFSCYCTIEFLYNARCSIRSVLPEIHIITTSICVVVCASPTRPSPSTMPM